MINLFLSILFSTSIFVIFKYFNIYKVNTLQAIVINYLVAFILGMLDADAFSKLPTVISQPWFVGALCLGFLFVSVFFVMATTSQKNGVSVASVAGKMSVVVPIAFGVILYNESLAWLKVLGIVLALIAVYLSSVKEKDTLVTKSSLLFPILLFLGSGVIDTLLKFIEKNYVSDIAFFSGTLFGIAFVFGTLILAYKRIVYKETIALKSVIAGIALGVPNYFSIIFLMKAFKIESLESSTLFTINNIGVVVVSTIVGLILFKEHFSVKNKIGIGLAILGIVLVALA